MSLKNVLKVKDPKLSKVLIDQNNVYATVHGAIGGERQQETCSFLLGNCYILVLAAGKKKCSRHRIYARACVNKDFVHSGSIGLI